MNQILCFLMIFLVYIVGVTQMERALAINNCNKQLIELNDSIVKLNSHIHLEQQLIKSVKIVESNNIPNKIGDSGKAYGSLQIHNIAVKEVNRIYGTKYKHKDMFNDSIASEVFWKYINMSNVHYKNKYKKSPDIYYLLRMYNGGYVPRDGTLVYVSKVKRVFLDLEKRD